MLVTMLLKQELHGFKQIIKAHTRYIISLPTRDWYGNKHANGDGSVSSDDEDSFTRLTPWPEADNLKKITAGVSALQVKIKAELRYVKREVAWGKLGAKDYEKICNLLKNVLLPILGMESLTKVADRIEKRGGWGAVSFGAAQHSMSEADFAALEEKERQQWLWMFNTLRGRVHRLREAMMEGIDHVLYTLEIEKRPKSDAKKDVESNRLEGAVGERLDKMMQDFLKEREEHLKEWCASKGLDDLSQREEQTISGDYPLMQRHQTQLYLFLDVRSLVLIFGAWAC